MFFREKNSYKCLPIEVLLKIYNHLSPEQAAMTATVNKSTSEFIRDNLLWENKFQLHFPHRYDAIDRQKDINWYVKFLDTYHDEYRYLSGAERQLFSLVKEGDIEGLKTKNILPSFTNKVIDIEDKSGRSFLNWAQLAGNQPVLNYFYQILRTNLFEEDEMNVTKTDYLYRTKLHRAITCHQPYDQIQSLISQGGMISEKYHPMYCEPIHIAAEAGHLEVVQKLIEQHPELLNQFDGNNQTPLHWAARKGQIRVLDYLISQDVKLNESTIIYNNRNRGRTPLHWAANHGHVESVSKLLRAGAIATTMQAYNKFQPIHLAVKNGHFDVVKVLLDKNPELLEQGDVFRQTPLLWAAAKGHLEMLNYLISENANLDVSTDNPNGINHGKTPLHWAAECGHNEVVKTLLEAGMMPSLTKPINKSKLNEEVRAEVALREHPSKRHRKL